MTKDQVQKIAAGTKTKEDIVEAVHSRMGLSRKDTQTNVEVFFELIKDALKRNQSVKIQNFGTFRVRRKQARIGRNPQTGERMKLKSRWVCQFQSSKTLKLLLNPHRKGSERLLIKVSEPEGGLE